MTTRLRESGTVAKRGGKFRATLITEGVGSSGTYPGETLQRDGATALPAGTQIFFDHLTESEEWERNGNHSVKDLVGVTLTDAEWVESERALEADVRFFGDHATFIEEVKDHVGLSIEAAGVIHDGVVESLVFSPFNAVAVVPRAGRGGKVTALIESYREKRNAGESDKLTEGTSKNSADPEDGKDKGMTPEEINALRESLVGAVKDAVTGMTAEIKEALVPKPAENEETQAVKASEVAEALVASGLPESARKRVYVALEADEKADVSALIEAEKKYIEDVRESLKPEDDGEPVGTVRESATKTDGETYSVAGWSR